MGCWCHGRCWCHWLQGNLRQRATVRCFFFAWGAVPSAAVRTEGGALRTSLTVFVCVGESAVVGDHERTFSLNHTLSEKLCLRWNFYLPNIRVSLTFSVVSHSCSTSLCGKGLCALKKKKKKKKFHRRENYPCFGFKNFVLILFSGWGVVAAYVLRSKGSVVLVPSSYLYFIGMKLGHGRQAPLPPTCLNSLRNYSWDRLPQSFWRVSSPNAFKNLFFYNWHLWVIIILNSSQQSQLACVYKARLQEYTIRERFFF